MVARMTRLKGAGGARAGSSAAGAACGGPETQSMPQRAYQVIQLVEQLRQSFHR